MVESEQCKRIVNFRFGLQIQELEVAARVDE